MRNYEIVFIVHPDLDETSLKDVVSKVKGWITDANGSVTKEDIWGKRRMAYAIKKQREGQYVLLNAEIEPAAIGELERNFRITEPIIRFIVTVVED